MSEQSVWLHPEVHFELVVIGAIRVLTPAGQFSVLYEPQPLVEFNSSGIGFVDGELDHFEDWIVASPVDSSLHEGGADTLAAGRGTDADSERAHVAFFVLDPAAKHERSDGCVAERGEEEDGVVFLDCCVEEFDFLLDCQRELGERCERVRRRDEDLAGQLKQWSRIGGGSGADSKRLTVAVDMNW